MCVVFRRDMDVSSKNPGGGVNPARAARRARRLGRVSLGYFSLHEQREVTRSCEAGAKALLSIFRFHAWPLAWPFDYRVGTDVQGKPEQGREQDQRLSLPFGARATLTSHSAVEELFFARAKKRGPKKARPAYAPSPLRGLGPLRRRDFSTRHSCLVEKRRASLHAALRVFPAGSVAAEGDSERQKQLTPFRRSWLPASSIAIRPVPRLCFCSWMLTSHGRKAGRVPPRPEEWTCAHI